MYQNTLTEAMSNDSTMEWYDHPTNNRSPVVAYNLSPKELVAELDKYVVGQDVAKLGVAIALRRFSALVLPLTSRQPLAPPPNTR